MKYLPLDVKQQKINQTTIQECFPTEICLGLNSEIDKN